MNEESLIEVEDEKLYNTVEKWLIRKKWLEYAIKRQEKNKKDFVEFFTLTCSQIYDVRLFDDYNLILSKETSPTQKQYLSVTFCEKDKHRHSLIRDKLAGAKSHLCRFEDLVGAGRVGVSNKVNGWFPFDVLNLDLNEAPFKENSRIMLDVKCAIRKLFIIQKLKNRSFSLFLTTCASEEGDDEKNKEDLHNRIDNNLKRNNEFKDLFFKKYPEGKFDNYHEFLLTAIPKLIIEHGFDEGFDIKCEEKFTYIGGNNITRMVSFIFDCEYRGSINSLVKIKPMRVSNIIERNFWNINEMLNQDKSLLKEIEELKEKYS